MALVAIVKRFAVTVRRYNKNLAFVARADKHVALRIYGKRPNIFGFWIEEDSFCAVWRYFVHFTVRRRTDVEIAPGIEGDCLRGELRRFKDSRRLTRRVEAKNLRI
jgi:hypothetical protein